MCNSSEFFDVLLLAEFLGGQLQDVQPVARFLDVVGFLQCGLIHDGGACGLQVEADVESCDFVLGEQLLETQNDFEC